MPLFGAHLSIAGGYHKAIDSAVALGMETVQLFTSSPSQWSRKPITTAEIADFQKALKASKLKFPTAHDSYLINLAAPDEALYRRSIASFADELDRAAALGLTYLVTHPGSHVGSGEEAGLEKVAAALDEVLASRPDCPVTILLETTAGQGSSLGAKFEHLAYLLETVKEPKRLGVCLDTCHVFAAGYALGTNAEYDATFQEFDRVVGLKWLKLFHVNDSVKPLGSRVDRHAGLGLGKIGLGAFRRLVADPRFAKKPMILETPKEADDGTEMDPVNLGILRSFRENTGR
ncbi:MAG: deoxyribonuclease IV [Gemmataceae bacterium]|nr:deoxyribonuclease IV [Planctomycetia bacterium]MBX3398979.1 deoxyribonuclease IV [Gemmataceae bacterium]